MNITRHGMVAKSTHLAFCFKFWRFAYAYYIKGPVHVVDENSKCWWHLGFGVYLKAGTYDFSHRRIARIQQWRLKL